jgi:hypothetical protein
MLFTKLENIFKMLWLLLTDFLTFFEIFLKLYGKELPKSRPVFDRAGAASFTVQILIKALLIKTTKSILQTAFTTVKNRKTICLNTSVHLTKMLSCYVKDFMRARLEPLQNYYWSRSGIK